MSDLDAKLRTVFEQASRDVAERLDAESAAKALQTSLDAVAGHALALATHLANREHEALCEIYAPGLEHECTCGLAETRRLVRDVLLAATEGDRG